MIPMLGSNTAYCVKLSGDDFARYSNKIESNWFKKMSVSLSYLESDVTVTNILQFTPHHGGQTAGIDMLCSSLSITSEMT